MVFQHKKAAVLATVLEESKDNELLKSQSQISKAYPATYSEENNSRIVEERKITVHIIQGEEEAEGFTLREGINTIWAAQKPQLELCEVVFQTCTITIQTEVDEPIKTIVFSSESDFKEFTKYFPQLCAQVVSQIERATMLQEMNLSVEEVKEGYDLIRTTEFASRVNSVLLESQSA